MFEGHIKPSGLDEAQESSVLRHLRWTDLVARLEAKGETDAALSRIQNDVLSRGKFSRRRPVAVANDAALGDRDDT
jgi:hypothetical protein